MKKYLMTGIAAVAMCAAFTSCSKDTEFEQITPEKISEMNYEQAFVSRFGEIASNQDWGFGKFAAKSARTRATVDPNGNMWDDCPTVGSTERNDVYTYVNTLGPRAKVIPSDLSTYFVTHIYRGNETHGSSNYPTSNMNQLEFAETPPASITWDGKQEGKWFHIYDFNAAISTDYEGNMRVINTPPLNFAYYNSSDSKWHDKWIGVDGADIPKAGGGTYAGYYYICFDFEAMPSEIYTIFQMPEADGAKVYVEGRFVGENGAPATGADLKALGIYTVKDKFTGETYTVQDNWFSTQVFNEHYYAPGNDNYTDWIIRLVKAADEDEDFPAADVRVLAEDLDVTENFDGQTYKGDFDFNDAVFDVVYDYQGTTWIIVQAAGGTYPLYVDGNEVHAALGGNTSQMIHTDGTKGPSRPINLGKKYTDANNIPVIVELPSGRRELTAGVGKAPHKLAVDKDFEWMGERISIETLYPLFSQWVKHPDTKWY